MSRRTPSSWSRRHAVAAVTVGFGLVYLVILAAFALTSSPRPPALGWLGFVIVAGIVFVVTWTLGEFMARSDRGRD